VIRFRWWTLALLLLLAGCYGGSRPPRIGSPAPDFTVKDSDRQVTLSQLRGQIVVLNFWATWCPPCRTEIPLLQRVHTAYAARGFTVVGVAMDERGWAAVTPFLAQHRVEYPVLLGNAAVARRYGGLKTLPYTLFLDRAGRVVATHAAALTETPLRRIVETLLSEAGDEGE
jgi:cytochrome c biogenesis protein CcmG/thiol:disulfide interchange protein DsbE